MEEIPNNHLGCTKPYKQLDIYHINWCRISSINSYTPSWWSDWFRSCFRRTDVSSLTENYFFIADVIDVLGYLRVDGEEMANLKLKCKWSSVTVFPDCLLEGFINLFGGPGCENCSWGTWPPCLTEMQRLVDKRTCGAKKVWEARSFHWFQRYKIYNWSLFRCMYICVYIYICIYIYMYIYFYVYI